MRTGRLVTACSTVLALLADSGCSRRSGSRTSHQAHPVDSAVLPVAVVEDVAVDAQAAPPSCSAHVVVSNAWPADPSYERELTVHVTWRGPRGGSTVGWASSDGRRMGILNVVYGTELPTYRGTVPAEPLQLYVDGLLDNEPYEAHAQVDMRKRKSAELTIALDEPRELVSRPVVVRDRAGTPIAGARGLPVLDGSFSAVRVAVLNFQQWISDDQGMLRVRSVAGEPVQLSITVPLLARPVQGTLMPGERELRLNGVTLVRCSFRCPATGKSTAYPGFVAVAELADGTCNRFEMVESDGLSSADITLAWPEGARALTISSSPYRSTSLTSPDQRCELHPLPERHCERWY